MSAVIVTGSAAEEEYAVDTGSMMQATWCARRCATMQRIQDVEVVPPQVTSSRFCR